MERARTRAWLRQLWLEMRHPQRYDLLVIKWLFSLLEVFVVLAAVVYLLIGNWAMALACGLLAVMFGVPALVGYALMTLQDRHSSPHLDFLKIRRR